MLCEHRLCDLFRFYPIRTDVEKRLKPLELFGEFAFMSLGSAVELGLFHTHPIGGSMKGL